VEKATGGIGIRIQHGICIKNPYQMSRRDSLWLISGRQKKKNKNNTIAAAVWVEIKIETVF